VVTVRFTFSGAETQRMLRYMLLRSRGPMAMLAAGFVILAVAVSVDKPLWFAVAGAELLGWVGLVTLMPRASVRSQQSEQTLSFSEDGVSAANEHGSQRFEWNHWRLWTRTGDLYLLRGPRGVFTFLPARAFGSPAAESEFRELLVRHLPPAGRRAGGAAG
jgi:YcxB-like protein